MFHCIKSIILECGKKDMIDGMQNHFVNEMEYYGFDTEK